MTKQEIYIATPIEVHQYSEIWIKNLKTLFSEYAERLKQELGLNKLDHFLLFAKNLAYSDNKDHHSLKIITPHWIQGGVYPSDMDGLDEEVRLTIARYITDPEEPYPFYEPPYHIFTYAEVLDMVVEQAKGAGCEPKVLPNR